MARTLSQSIDHLYQLPLSEFTPARNALAAELTGAEAAEVKSLRKPTAPAWAVNQLYWNDPDAFLRIEKTVGRLGKAMVGRSEDRSKNLAAANEEHRKAVQEALRRTMEILERSGQSPSPNVQRDVLGILRALPGDEPPGRLTRQPEPRGFESVGNVGPPSRESRIDRGIRGAKKEDKRKGQRDRKEAERRLKEAESDLARSRKESQKARFRSRQAEEALRKARTEEFQARRLVERAEAKTAIEEENLRKAQEHLRHAESEAARAQQVVDEVRRTSARR